MSPRSCARRGWPGGDLDSLIDYTHHSDCVGRMTKAMDVFRANALAVRKAGEDQERIVTALGNALSRLSDADLTSRLNEALPGKGEARYLSLPQRWPIAGRHLRSQTDAEPIQRQAPSCR